MYAQMKSQLESMESALKDKEGAIETLERQLVQAGIKGKVQDAEMEIVKKKEQEKASITVEANKMKGTAQTQQQMLKNAIKAEEQKAKLRAQEFVSNVQLASQRSQDQANLEAQATKANAVLESKQIKSVGNE